MASIADIKNWFVTRKYPTQLQFWEWIDSYWHKDEKIPQTQILDLVETLAQKAEVSQYDAFVKKTGTTKDDPITGDLVFVQPESDYTGTLRNGGDEGFTISNKDETTGYATALTVGLVNVVVGSTDPTARGFVGAQDFTANLEDLDYMQKIGVMRMIADNLKAATDTQSGFMRLYNSVAGNNIDGAPTQEAVRAAIAVLNTAISLRAVIDNPRFTNGIRVASGSQGFRIFNTADETNNYANVYGKWVANRFVIGIEGGGTEQGSSRSMSIGTGAGANVIVYNTEFGLNLMQSSNPYTINSNRRLIFLAGNVSPDIIEDLFTFSGNGTTFRNNLARVSFISLNHSVNLSTGAGYSTIKAIITEIALSSSTNYLLDLNTSDGATVTPRATITNRGQMSLSGGLNVGGVINLGMFTTGTAPAYQKGATWFNTTTNKQIIGGATVWETVTSA